jgi:hypothetical protein
MITSTNVVQVGEQNEVLHAEGTPDMGLMAGEVLAISGPDSERVGDLPESVAADMQSAVLCDSTQERAGKRHAKRHNPPHSAIELQTRGGRGVGRAAAASIRIGLRCAGNFSNAPADPLPQKQKKRRVVVVRAHGRKALFGREKKSGALVLVALGRGLHAERFHVDRILDCEQIDGRWCYHGPLPTNEEAQP